MSILKVVLDVFLLYYSNQINELNINYIINFTFALNALKTRTFKLIYYNDN